MRRFLLLLVLLATAAGGIYVWWAQPRTSAASEPGWRTQRVDRGTITAAVAATGTINPISTVIVGSQLSGQVIEILSDYNDVVRANQIMARLNTDQIRARLDGSRADLAQAQAQTLVQEAQIERNRADTLRAQASLADTQAQLRRVEAQLADAEATLARTQDLARRAIATDVQLQTARTAVETNRAQRDSARAQIRSAEAQLTSLAADQRVIEAQLASARAAVQQREAVIRQIEVDIRNSEIRSPVDGVVVQRNVELGQTVAASLQAPTLFLVAEDLRTMRIFANVDETDVGRVVPGQEVAFTVNAFPGRSFGGRVEQVRLGSQTVQNVVIYTAVILIDNQSMELRPGMTANLRVLTENRANVVRVPNAALRWRPPGETAQQRPPQAMNPFGGPLGPGIGGPPGGGGGGGQQQRPPGQGGGGAQQGQQAMAEMIETLKGELGLDAAQRARIDQIVAEVRREMRTSFNPQAPAAERREAFARFRETIVHRIGEILTEAQRPALDQVVERLAERPGSGVWGRIHVVGPDGTPQARRVRLGPSDGTFTEVLSGRLAEGDQVIVGGSAPRPPAANPLARFFGS